MRSWPVHLQRNWQCYIASVSMKSHPTFATALITLVSDVTGLRTFSFSVPSFKPLTFMIVGDQNAINDLMQMRLTGGGGGMMAEKLEVHFQQLLDALHNAPL